MSGGGLPVVLSLGGQTVLVVGGGRVGRRKASAAGAAGAAVRIVALEPRHAEFAEDGDVEWLTEPYDRVHLTGVKLAFAAGPPDVNRQVIFDASAAGVWACSATDPEDGDVVLPAAVRRGPFYVAVGTGGAAPAFARRVRERLEYQFDTTVGEFVGLLAEVRPIALAAVSDPAARRELLDRLADWPWLERLRRDGLAATRAAMWEEVRRAGEKSE
jgi:precorrin-2 dehydrogenase/sirohydrochlorin ferrochelatase